ncbi:transmembrane protein 14C-like [Anoplophora glabripennis]|uniref:transmembrane protein 14C-like n=1 Tax=Anoplophora glabripennis TaxID=217634 RepID=UPI000874CD92|nr:transmembrane protein 14C-like [Anoplophora glabripennis]
MSADIPGYIFAGAVAAGGILGYYKARSVPSLAAGLVFGGILFYGAHEVSKNPENYCVQLAASSILGGVMGYRYYNKKKFMPAGAVFLASVAMIFRILAKANTLPSPSVT